MAGDDHLERPVALVQEEAQLLARAVAREQLLVLRRPQDEDAAGEHRSCLRATGVEAREQRADEIRRDRQVLDLAELAG